MILWIRFWKKRFLRYLIVKQNTKNLTKKSNGRKKKRRWFWRYTPHLPLDEALISHLGVYSVFGVGLDGVWPRNYRNPDRQIWLFVGRNDCSNPQSLQSRSSRLPLDDILQQPHHQVWRSGIGLHGLHSLHTSISVHSGLVEKLDIHSQTWSSWSTTLRRRAYYRGEVCSFGRFDNRAGSEILRWAGWGSLFQFSFCGLTQRNNRLPPCSGTELGLRSGQDRFHLGNIRCHSWGCCGIVPGARVKLTASSLNSFENLLLRCIDHLQDQYRPF